MDSGYVDQFSVQDLREILGVHMQVKIAKRSEPRAFKVMPKRWILL